MVYHRTLTLTGSPQNLNTLFPTVKGLVRFLSIQGAAANAGLVYVGGAESTLSSTDFGFRIELPVSTVPSAPSIVELPQGLYGMGNIQVLGTNNDKIYLFIITQ